MTEVAAWLPSSSRQRQARDKGSGAQRDPCLPARRAGIALCAFPISSRCLHRTGKPRAKPAPRHLGKITRYIYMCFRIITFTDQNKEQRQVVLAEQPRGFVGAFWGSLVLRRAGVRSQQPGPAWGMGWGQAYGQHHAPVLDHHCPFRSPRHLPGCAKWAVPCLLSQAGHPNWAGRLQPPPGSKRSPQQVCILLQTRGKVLGLGGRSFVSHALPCVARVVRVKEIVRHHCLAGVDLDFPGVLRLERGS